MRKRIRQPSWNTTVVAERRCARKGNMFHEAVRLDCKANGFAFDDGMTERKGNIGHGFKHKKESDKADVGDEGGERQVAAA